MVGVAAAVCTEQGPAGDANMFGMSLLLCLSPPPPQLFLSSLLLFVLFVPGF